MMKRFTTYIVPMLALAVSACSSETTPVPDEPARQPRPDEVTLVLDVSINGGTASTRADGDPDRYDPASGEFEYIDGLRVLIVRGIEKDETTGKETGIIEGNRLVATDAQGNPLYDNLEFKVQANEDKRIYLIANERFLTPPASFVAANPLNPTSSKFLDQFLTSSITQEKRFDISVLNDWTFNMNPTIVRLQTDQRLPLTEFFNIHVGSKDESVDQRWFSHLFLTRTAAKTRFFLSTSEAYAADNAVVPVIKSIRISGLGTKEYVFPLNTEYAPKTKDELITSGTDNSAKLEDAYIKQFTTPTDNTPVSYLFDEINAKVVKPSGDRPTVLTDMLYFSESILETDQNYVVTVNFTDGKSLTAPLKNIKDQVEANILSIAGKDAIARNTYLPIQLQFHEAMNLSVSVLPWEREEFEFDFSEHVGMSSDGALTFTQGTYADNGLDKSTGRLVLRDYPLATSGTFTIGSPVGQRWDAYLITTKGEQNAIQFVVKDSEGKDTFTDHISGIVGEKVNFRVAATSSASTEQREAVMQVMVSLQYGGISVPVNILEGDSEYETDQITFIQNSK